MLTGTTEKARRSQLFIRDEIDNSFQEAIQRVVDEAETAQPVPVEKPKPALAKIRTQRQIDLD